jgi:hypothetical protein
VGFAIGIIGDVLAYVKQNEIDKARKILDEKIDSFYNEEVKERRMMVSEMTRSIVQIDIELKKIDMTYKKIQETVPGSMLKTIDQYIYNLKKKRVELESLKKRTALIRQ